MILSRKQREVPRLSGAGFPSAGTKYMSMACDRMRTANKVISLALVFSILFAVFPLRTASAAMDKERRVPLLLISEPKKGGLSNEKECIWVKSGLVSRLSSSGYHTGEDLFVFTPDTVYEDLDSGARTIRNELNRILTLTKGAEIDIAAYGISGLVFRAGLEMGIIEDGLVRNAIMFTAPQRGSFLAGELFDACQVIKHEAIFEEDTRKARFSPFGNIGEPLGGNRVPANSTGNLPSTIGSGKFSWESETHWVGMRASELYEPLYAEYVKTRFLSLPYVPMDSPKETFPGWIKRSHASIWENCIVSKSVPPFGPLGQSNAVYSSPRKGEDFTTAYYEILAMDVGRNQYVVRQASKGSLARSLLSGEYVPINWKDALLYYGGKALIHYAKKALVTVKAEVQKVVMDNIVKSVDYLESADDPVFRRLVKEDVLVNLGSSAGNRFVRIRANHYLGSLNEKSHSKCLERKTRYVTITGKITNIAGSIWPGTAPNNLFCEVDSSIPPLGQRDIVQVYSGMFSPSYLDLLKNKKVQESIISLLKEDLPTRDLKLKSGGNNHITASSWAPTYVHCDWKTPANECFEISANMPAPPEGWRYLTWLEGNDGTTWLPIPGSCQVIQRAGEIRIYLKSDSHRAGFRLTREGPLNPFTPGGKVSSAFEKEVTQKVKLSALSMSADSLPHSEYAKDPVPLPEPGPTADVPNENPPQEYVDIGDLGQEFEPEHPQAPEPETDVDGIPAIRVVYRNKHTTLKEPKETYHAYWEADFGDGESSVIVGEPETVITHTFQPLQSCQVEIVSYDNYGKVLLKNSYTVDVPGPDAQVCEFRCRSIVAPNVDLEISGPKKWVTGKYAVFDGKVNCDLPRDAQITDIEYDPGERFKVLWERSGEFLVYWAATLTIEYDIDGQIIKVKNTYVDSSAVDVFTPGVTR